MQNIRLAWTIYTYFLLMFGSLRFKSPNRLLWTKFKYISFNERVGTENLSNDYILRKFVFALLSNLFVKTSLLSSLFLLLERIICLTRNGAILRNRVRQRGTYWRWKEREWVWRCLRHPPAGLRPTLLRDIHHCSRVDFTRVLCLQATVLLRYQWANRQHLLHSDNHAYTLYQFTKSIIVNIYYR